MPRRRIRDGALDGPHAVAGRDPQVRAPHDLGQDQIHLHGGECGAEAAPDTAAEGEEVQRVRAHAEEPLGAESLRLGPQVGATMGEVDRRRDAHPSREQATADTRRLAQDASREADDGAEPLRLLHHRVEVLEARQVLRLDRPVARNVGELLDHVRHHRDVPPCISS